MTETKSVKTLKKQLGAAITMVCVAAVALGSSTYAWFVSNNQVTATTSTISAQSNAPFLKIDNQQSFATAGTESKFSKSAVSVLYPAQVVGEFADGDDEVTANKAKANDVKFQSAYASAATAATEKGDTRFTVGNPAAAVIGEYAYMESFWIGSDDAEAGSFANLKVESVSVAADKNATWNGYTYEDAQKQTQTVTGEQEKTQMVNAVRILFVNHTTGAWQVWGNGNASTTTYTTTAGSQTLSGTKLIASNGALADKIDANSQVQIDVYMFYDGADANIFTNNLKGLHDVGATVTFTAEAVSTTGSNTGVGARN